MEHPFAQTCYSPPAPQPLNQEQLKSVIITDPAILGGEDFSLGSTLGAITKSSSDKVADSQAERIALLTSLIRSFRATDRINSQSGLTLHVDQRLGEAELDPVKLLAASGPGRMKTVALFNRWDLVPQDAHHCGEHRIVFAREPDASVDPAGNPAVRFLLIFEAALDNPDPANSLEGCRPIVEFWRNLEGKPANQLKDALTAFYFHGLDANGDGKPDFQPVVHAQHYGAPYGQVRGNLFMHTGNPGDNKWQLREWRVSITSDGAPVFTADTDKKNPHPALYAARAADEVEGGFDRLRRDFSDEFVQVYTDELTQLDPKSTGSTVSGNDLIAKFGANFRGKFDSFESTSQGDRDDPNARASATLRPRINPRLSELNVPSACALTEEHVLNRAGAVSCGGCHQFSNDKLVAPGVPWPKSATFVQIDERGATPTVSPALRDHFLPTRYQFLQSSFPAPVAVATAPPAGVAASVPSARQALQAVKTSDTRLQALDALKNFEGQVQELRARDSLAPGVYVPIRRVH
jgi:hypothetical protein